ncbi:hypothetical protein Gekk315_00050 [Aeromonas phage Gekk3-15]
MALDMQERKKLSASKSRLACIKAELPRTMALVECGLSPARELENLLGEQERLVAVVARLEACKNAKQT